jgi:hypothetical protein
MRDRPIGDCGTDLSNLAGMAVPVLVCGPVSAEVRQRRSSPVHLFTDPAASARPATGAMPPEDDIG